MKRLLPILLLLAVSACGPQVEVPDSIHAQLELRDVEQRPFDSLQVQRYLYQIQRRDPDPQILPDLIGGAAAIAAEWGGTRRVSSRWLGFDFIDLADGTFLIREDTSRSVPLTVIFPAQQPERPILIRDLYTQSQLLEKLKQAVALAPRSSRQASAGGPIRN